MAFKNLNSRRFLFCALYLTVLATSHSAFSQSKKSKTSTQVYEKESTEESFTAKVSVVREIQEETEVFFEGPKKGPYVLPDGPSHGLFMERLEKSKKSSGPQVKVTIDNDRIQSVDILEKKEAEGAVVNEEELMKSIYKDR